MPNEQKETGMSILTIGGWFNTFQRPHHFAKLFRKYFHVTVTNNVELLPKRAGQYMAEQKDIVDSIDDIYLLRGRRYKPIRVINYFLFHYQLKKNLNKPAFRNAGIVYTWNVYDIGYLKHVKDKVVIYDAMDDWSEFTGTNSGEVIANELELAQRADIVLCVSEKIYQRLAILTRNAVLVRNGVDDAYFALARNYSRKPSDQLYPYKDRAVVGYMGHIQDWVDVDLIINTAKMLNDVMFAIIGPGSSELTDKFKVCENILYLGPKPYSELVSYLAYCKVGIIPFKLNALNESTNPIKLYEYLGAGLPVVSTGMNEVKLYQQEGVVYIADTAPDFAARINNAIETSGNSEMIEKRMAVSENNSWSSRFEVVHREIKRCMAGTLN